MNKYSIAIDFQFLFLTDEKFILIFRDLNGETSIGDEWLYDIDVKHVEITITDNTTDDVVFKKSYFCKKNLPLERKLKRLERVIYRDVKPFTDEMNEYDYLNRDDNWYLEYLIITTYLPALEGYVSSFDCNVEDYDYAEADYLW